MYTNPKTQHSRTCVEQPGLCSNPTAVVGVTDPTRGSVLVGGQRYRVVIDMEMPESHTNQKIGNDPTIPRHPGLCVCGEREMNLCVAYSLLLFLSDVHSIFQFFFFFLVMHVRSFAVCCVVC